MKPRITLITLGVDDLERSMRFYRDGMGWPTQGIIGTEFEHGAVAFFDLQPGLKLALWAQKNIAQDTGLPATPRATGACSLVFLDPPYGEDLAAPALTALAQSGWLADGALVVVEIAAKEDLEVSDGFAPFDERRYGAAKFLFLRYGK